jgi:uncharacterized protein with ATP-grasp and redox domains
VEEQNDVASIVYIIPEQRYGVIVSHGAYMSTIRYHDGFEEVVELFDESDFIVSNEIGIINTGEN